MYNTYEKISELLIKNNLTANALSVKLEINNTLFSQWKQGKSKPSFDILVKIAKYFNVSLDYFIDRDIQTTQIVNGSGIVANGNVTNNGTYNGTTNSVKDVPLMNDMETDLLSIYREIDTRKKTALLTYAYSLEKE